MDNLNGPETLFVIFDVNPKSWAEQEAAGNKTLQQIMVDVKCFLNSFLAIKRQNRLSLIAVSHVGQKLIWSTENMKNEFPFGNLSNQFLQGMKDLLEEGSRYTAKREHSCITGGLCRALCMINRHQKNYPNQSHRILIIQNCEDCTPDYVKFMNCVFSAQKKRIVIDAVVLNDKDSLFCQQACHLTNGIHYSCGPKSNERKGFNMILTTIFLPTPMLRKTMPILHDGDVDLRATCFCCPKHVSKAFVCPVCLAIYCNRYNSCPTCNARLPRLLKRKRNARETKI